MNNRWPAPLRLLVFALAAAIVLAGAVTFFAAKQPRLGLRLVYDAKAGGAVVRAVEGPAAAIPVGTVLTAASSGQETIRFVADDFVIEPDGALGTYDDYSVFLTRQAALARIQASSVVSFTDATGKSWTIAPGPSRPLTSLPADFWVQLAVGVFAWLISASIWVFRPRETSARYLLLSGFATLMFAPFAAAYTTRELSMPRVEFQWLNDLNFLGGSLFAASLAALLLYYPRKLAPRWVGLAIVGVFVAWFIAQQVGVFESMTMARRLLVMIALLATFALAGVQWFLTRKDPVARAALQWFLLSWVVCVSIFGLGILLPQMFGVDTSKYQGYAFLLFLLVYVGLAFGIMRFRLFDLGEWWVRAVIWATSILVLIAFDILFLMGLNLSQGLSLSLALLMCGLVWLPLRSWLWARFLGRAASGGERMRFESVVEVAFTQGPDERDAKWRALLQAIFDPLNVSEAEPVAETTIDDNGLALVVPSIDGIPALRLAYARGGRRLFTRGDASLAEDLAGMLRHVVQSRSAYDQGVAVERKRIASDIHDNIGAPLLNALRTENAPRKDELIRETLSDLRAIINDASQTGDWTDALAHIRRETAERLEASGVELDWPIEETTAVNLSSPLIHVLRSVIREAVSNVLKHAGARHVHIAVGNGASRMTLVVEDDGAGFDPAVVAGGNGLANIRDRLRARGGKVEWTRGGSGRGTRLEAEVPLEA